MGDSRLQEVVKRRYRAPEISTVFAKTGSRDALGISHVRVPPTLTERLAPEPGFTVQIQTGVANERAELYVDDKPVGLQPQRPGFIRIVDMAARPFADIHTDAEFVQLNLTYRTLDDLAYERGSPAPMRLRQTVNVKDPVLHGLALALTAHHSFFGEGDPLFVDYAGMALHAHVARHYAERPPLACYAGRLSPRQLKAVCDRMMDNMGGVSLAELAAICGVSQSYFIRAFRHTTGLPPHRWLMAERIKMAKKLLLGPMPLINIAHACGFADQSHMTRVFTRSELMPPGRWRRHFRGGTDPG